MSRNVALYPWFKFVQNLVFWQATWFLYFQNSLSAAEAILLYAIYDLATTILEVPSGYMSDRLGRRVTLICAAVAAVAAQLFLATGASFWAFATGQILFGAFAAFTSGTDSSLLYESLNAEGRADEIEAAELTAWRAGFVALALSAVAGGAMALYAGALPFFAGALAAGVLLTLTLRMSEPPHAPQPNRLDTLRDLQSNLTHPVLVWLLVLNLLMYVFSHIPFVFGQPFIQEALAASGYSAEAPLVSGLVTAVMMGLSVLVSLVALVLRNRMGLPAILLLAFGIQIGLIGALALSNNVFVIALLFLRMVPNSLSQPFIQARIQPLLKDGTRATYLSVQSLAGRLLFAGTLALAAGNTTSTDQMPYGQMQGILASYAGVGMVCLVALALTARRARVAPDAI